MSQAFVKESDDNGLLHQVAPNIPALVNYIKAETSYGPVFVKQVKKENGKEMIVISNGLSYFINNDNNWEMCL